MEVYHAKDETGVCLAHRESDSACDCKLAGQAKPKPKFPASSLLCGIQANDSLQKVKKLYGTNYRLYKGRQGEYSSIIYNDPKANAQLTIAYGGNDMGSDKGKVVTIILQVGRIKGGYRATKSFARLGDCYGLTLGSDISKFRKFYTEELRSYDGGKQHGAMVDLLSDNSYYIDYHYENKKLTRIDSTYSYG